MKKYMENKNIKARKEDKTYLLESIEVYDGIDYMHLNMVNINDQEDTETEICYFLEESVKECLEWNEYEIVKEKEFKDWRIDNTTEEEREKLFNSGFDYYYDGISPTVLIDGTQEEFESALQLIGRKF